MKQAAAHLLVVEDDDILREATQRYFEREGFAVTAAADGELALGALHNQRFDLVVLDVMMPGIGGIDVLKSVRSRFSSAELPVIMATAHGKNEQVIEALDLGANDYLTKPFDFGVALARVRAQLSIKESHDQLTNRQKRLRQANRTLEAANAQLSEQHQRWETELAEAGVAQRALLPHKPPELPGVRFAWRFQPCTQLAGDLLNVIPVDERRVVVYVLDVMGHGTKAALLAVRMHEMLQQLLDPAQAPQTGKATSNLSPAWILDRVNQAFPWDDRTEQFCTTLCGVLDLETLQLNLASAGHPGPLVVKNGQFSHVPLRGRPIGLGQSAYDIHPITLTPGDRMYLYTDGVIENSNPQSQPFGKDRLGAALAAAAGDDLDASLTTLFARLDAWRGDGRLLDDASILGLEISRQ